MIMESRQSDMAFINAAGFAFTKTATPSSTGTARLQSGPQVLSTAISQDSLFHRVSSSLCENTSSLHRTDFERANRRAESSVLLRDALTDLRARMGRKTGGRDGAACADAGLELAYKAS